MITSFLRRRVEWGYRADLIDSRLGVWLDHFRWLAALMVAVSHTRNLLMPDFHSGLNAAERVLYFFTLFATQSVVIFFVLSGLLVGGSIVRRARADELDLADYFIDRATRLYVVLVPALVLTAVLQWAGQALQCDGPDSPERYLANLAFLQNFGVTGPPCNNSPLWSLSSEAFFYVLAPLVVVAATRRSWLALALSCGLILASLATFVDNRAWTGFGLMLWMAGLLPWFVRLCVSAVVMVLPVLAVLLLMRFHLLSDDRTGEALLAIAFAALLCADFSGVRAPWPRFGAAMAGFSFSLYLVHMPIAGAVAQHTGLQGLPSGEARTYLIYGASITTMIATGWVFGRLFEARTADLRRAVRRGWSLDARSR